jgi:branched-chain amino acid transport system ATP-binding protein
MSLGSNGKGSGGSAGAPGGNGAAPLFADPPQTIVPGPPLLELRGVTAAYGRIEVLHGIDLVVAEGSVCALLGPNGAGKTTTISVCSGLMVPTGGDLYIAGRRVNGASPDQLARAGVCTVPEGRGIFPNLTVRENLQMMTLTGRSIAEIEASAYERFPRLSERRKQVAGTLSGGEQQMLSLARGLATDPALLLLDELSMGLAPMIVEELYGIVAQIAASGVSILIVEQFARTVLGVADTAALMLHGHVTKVGEPHEIERELSSAYLGGDTGPIAST